MILFDEHGGTFDHVVPPSAVSPDGVTVTDAGGWNFTFDRLGVRVPAVLVSPWIGPQVCNTVFDHTSVLRSVIDRFGLPDALGQRVAQATGIDCVLDLAAPRGDVPTITPPNPKWSPDQFSIDDPKLTKFQRELLALGVMTAGDMFRAADVGNILGDILDHIGGDVFSLVREDRSPRGRAADHSEADGMGTADVEAWRPMLSRWANVRQECRLRWHGSLSSRA